MRLRRSPLAELVELQRQVSRVFEEVRAERARLSGPTRLAPAMDVLATEEAYLVRLSLPGVTAGDVRVMVDAGTLLVKGRKAEGPHQGRVLRRERQYGEFLRTLSLPSDADPSDASARLADGVLRLRIARRPVGGRREIPVTEDEAE